MTSALPGCDEVFATYFDRWYELEDRKRKKLRATRPDIVRNPGLKGLSPQEASPLAEDGQAAVGRMLGRMIDAARGDWPAFLPVCEPIDIRWVDQFDKFHDRGRVKALMEASNPAEFSNEFLVRCCEFGAVLGHVLLTSQPNLHWLCDWPYWESALFDPDTGEVIAVFHWAIKKFSEYGIDDGFKAKLLACAGLIQREREGQKTSPGNTP